MKYLSNERYYKINIVTMTLFTKKFIMLFVKITDELVGGEISIT